MTAPMTAAAANWIYWYALTPTYRRAVGAEGRGDDAGHLTGPDALRKCPCESGVCHGCQTGHHAGCARARIVFPAAYVIRADGHVAVVPMGDGRHSVWAAVLLSGRQCGWRCACGCGAPVEQLDLFDLAGGGR